MNGYGRLYQMLCDVEKRVVEAKASLPVDGETIDEIPTLTEREKSVLEYVCEGMSSGEIGTYLQLSARTIEAHRRRLMQKVGVPNTVQLVRWAIRVGMIRP